MLCYAEHFQKIMSWRHFGPDITGKPLTLVCCHYPLHPDTVKDHRRFKGSDAVCVHGHLHRRKIADPSYINVCVENIGYAPISLEELLSKIRAKEAVAA
jgi:calcineurin-like phosphoesterase family protein